MKISKFKKYICWNLISIIGFLSVTVSIYFLIMLSLASSQLHMRLDIDEFIYDYIMKHLVYPYLAFYKIQIITIIILLVSSIFERNYYIHKGDYGLRLFPEHDKGYSRLFVTGLLLNFCPLYVFMLFVIHSIMKFL